MKLLGVITLRGPYRRTGRRNVSLTLYPSGGPGGWEDQQAPLATLELSVPENENVRVGDRYTITLEREA